MTRTSVILFFVIMMMCSTVFAQSAYDYEDTKKVGQMWRIHIRNVSYEIHPPSKAEVIKDEEGEWIKFTETGDIEIIAYNLNDNKSYRIMMHVLQGDTDSIARGYGPEPSDADKRHFPEEVLKFVNIERAKVGAPLFTMSDELLDTSKIRANEIVQSFSHTRPNGELYTSLIKNGKYTVMENIAAGTNSPEATVRLWMDSPPHREAMLHPDFIELGVGYAFSNDAEYVHYWVLMFKRPMSKAYRL